MSIQDDLEFQKLHGQQLEMMGVPQSLFPAISSQLHETLVNVKKSQGNERDEDTITQHLMESSRRNFQHASTPSSDMPIQVMVTPHIVSFDIQAHPSDGLHKALSTLSLSTLQTLHNALFSTKNDCTPDLSKEEIIDAIVPHAWERLTLYRDINQNVMAALPCPPYPTYINTNITKPVDEEPNVMGPLPFAYIHGSNTSFCSISFVTLDNHNSNDADTTLTIDPVPEYTCANNPSLRKTRLAALLSNYSSRENIDSSPSSSLVPPYYEYTVKYVKQHHAEFVRQLHLVRQQVLEQTTQAESSNSESGRASIRTPTPSDPFLVYTDSEDFMKLTHPEAGLSDPRFKITNTIPKDKKIDIVFTFSSVFSPSSPFATLLKENSDLKPTFINQFPYEGAFVQKDHLAREIQKQHGLPRPSWALETYDLDVQLTEFVGAAFLEHERRRLEKEDLPEEDLGKNDMEPLWILKPAKGTRSKGHVVTGNIAQVLKVLDAGGGSRVAQKYIENPICYDNRKVDCRCIVLMRSASPDAPELYMHNRVFFRIAGKEHKIDRPSDIIDQEAVLTAMYLIKDENDAKVEQENTSKLPVDYKTIEKLEADYGDCGFDWNQTIVPKIHSMIRELFTGMAKAYPAMGKSECSRAVYGLDIMFEIVEQDCDQKSKIVEPKLTEVTFCPVNNSVSDAYERDENLYRNYNNDVFCCLFLGETSDNITKVM